MTSPGHSDDDARHARSPRRVALIDDDASIRRAVTGLLESVGFEVQAFASAEAFLGEDISRAECLLLDVELPGMTGFELLECLRAADSHIPVVMLTAHAGPEARRRATELGAFAVVAKPMDPSALVSAVQHALRPDAASATPSR
ncbi:MAG TPA: response regulator [Polyangiaceae bacterium]